MSNKPATWELYTLAAGQSKIIMSPDTKVPNAATFTIQKEDHTLANVLRNAVLSNQRVIFCGYKVPHPLEPFFLLKIQTNGEISPKDVLYNEIQKLIRSVSDLSKSFSVELESRRSLTIMRPSNSEFRRQSLVQKEVKKIVEDQVGILDLIPKNARTTSNFDRSVTYKFYKTRIDTHPQQPMQNQKQGKMERVSELVKLYFPSKDFAWSREYSIDLHHDFISDFKAVYDSKEMEGEKINDFTPETWARLSAVQEYKKKQTKINNDITADTEKKKIAQKLPLIENILCLTVQKSPEKVSKKIKDIFKKINKQEVKIAVNDDDESILPHGLDKLSKKVQTNYEKVLSILMESASITASDQALLNSTLKNFGAFHKLTSSVFERICQCIKLDIIPAKKCIFKQKDPGNCWYIILLGYVRIKVVQDLNTPFKEITAATLGPGEGFGEQAIVTDSDRAASAYAASSPTILARIDKSDYKRVMNFIRQMEKKEKLFFLKYVKLLSNLDPISLRNLADRITLRKFEIGQALIKESEICNSVYFIKSGSASVYRKVEISTGKIKDILVGKVYRGDSVNEDVLLDRSNYIGSLITVIADEPLEFGAVLAYGDLSTFPFKYTRPGYLNYTNNDLLRLYWIKENMKKFRKVQTRLTRELKTFKFDKNEKNLFSL